MHLWKLASAPVRTLIFLTAGAGPAGAVDIVASLSPAGAVAIGDEVTVTLSVAGWMVPDGEVDAVEFLVDFDTEVLEFVSGSGQALDDGSEFLARPNQGESYTLVDESDETFSAAGRYLFSIFDDGDFENGSVGPDGALGTFRLKAVALGSGKVTPQAANPNLVFFDPDGTSLEPAGGVVFKEATVAVEDSGAGVTYPPWAQAIGFPSPEAAAPDADPDNDGVPNLVEYGLGMNPLAGDPENLPAPGLVEAGGKRFASLTFTRPGGGEERTDLIYAGQKSADLARWSDEGVIVESVSQPDPESGRVIVVLRSTAAVDDGAVEAEFMRLVLTKS